LVKPNTPEITDRPQAGEEIEMYNVMKMFADGVERKKTLHSLAREIERDNPNTVVEIISQKNGRMWSGHAKFITADLCDAYLKRCVQGIEEDAYGITIVMR
jgi:hypothetical protein